jgi:hypothetical protein
VAAGEKLVFAINRRNGTFTFIESREIIAVLAARDDLMRLSAPTSLPPRAGLTFESPAAECRTLRAESYHKSRV